MSVYTPDQEALAAERGFSRLDLAGFLRDDPPDYDYLLDGCLEYGELCWIAGRGKSGKSMLALFLTGACLGGAARFLDREVGHLDWAVYIDGENREATIRRRVHLAGVSIDVAERIEYLAVRGVDLGSGPSLDVLRTLVTRPGRGLVVLDSLVALHTADEDKARDVRGFVDKLRSVFEPAGVTVLGLAHENRSGNLRGSLDWRNAADRTLELSKRADGARELSIGDVRDGPEDDGPLAFRFVPESDQRGRTRLLIETVPAASTVKPRTVREQLTTQIVLLRTGDPTLTRAKVALEVGRDTNDGTFKRAWNTATERIAAD